MRLESHTCHFSVTEELSQLGLKPGRKLRFEYAELKQSEKAQAEDVALTHHVEVRHTAHISHTAHTTRMIPTTGGKD